MSNELKSLRFCFYPENLSLILELFQYTVSLANTLKVSSSERKRIFLFVESVHISPVADPGEGPGMTRPLPPFILRPPLPPPPRTHTHTHTPYLKVWTRRYSPCPFLCAHDES